jgi:hypothetical protein
MVMERKTRKTALGRLRKEFLRIRINTAFSVKYV